MSNVLGERAAALRDVSVLIYRKWRMSFTWATQFFGQVLVRTSIDKSTSRQEWRGSPQAFRYFCFGTVLGSSCRQLSTLTLFSWGFFCLSLVLHCYKGTNASLAHSNTSHWYSLQIPAGMELICFIAPQMVSVLWICAETMLTTHHNFASCWAALA